MGGRYVETDVGSEWVEDTPEEEAAAAAQASKVKTRDDAIQKLTNNIIAQGSMDHWSTGSGLSKETAAKYMAEKLYNDGGITRLEDFAKIPVTQTVPVVTGHYETQLAPYDWENYTGATQQVFVPGTGQQGYMKPTPYTTTDSDGRPFETTQDVFTPFTSAEQAQVKDGKFTYDTGQTAYGNKVTGQLIPVNYNRAHPDDWGGTFAGDSSSGFGVQFNDLGMPMFYTHYDVDNSWMGPLGMALTALSFVPGVGPFAMAANAALQASQGNTTGAILSALGSTAGFVGSGLEAVNGMDLASDVSSLGYNPASVIGGIQTAQQAIGVMKAVSDKNFAGIISSLTNIAPQIGVTIPEDLMKPVQVAAIGSALSRGDWAAAAGAAGTLTNNSDLKLAGNGLRLANAIQSGRPESILMAGVDFARQTQLSPSFVKDTAKQIGIPLSDKRASDLLSATPAQADAQVQEYYKQVNTVKAQYQDQFGQPISNDLLEAFGNADSYIAGFNNYVTNKNTTTQEELNSFFTKAGLDPASVTQNQINSALSLSEAGAEKYAQNLADIKAVTFDGNAYSTKEEALAAAQKAGYNNFEQNGVAYTFMTGDKAKTIAQAASENKVPGVAASDFTTIAGEPFKWVDEKDIPTIVIVAKRQDAILPSNATMYDDWMSFVKESGGTSFPKWLSDQLAIATDTFKDAPAGSAASVIKNGLAFGARNFGSLASNLLRGAEAMGVDPNNSALKVSQAFERWGAKNQSQGIMDAEKQFSTGLNSISKATVAKELGISESQVKDWQVAARQIKELGNQIVNNPLGTLSVVGGEAAQEIPFLVASGGIGSVAAKMIGKIGGFAVARGTDAALNGFESFSGNYAEVKDHLIAQGMDPSKAEARALASGLEAMAVTAATSWVGDTALLKTFMKDMGGIAATAAVGAGAKEFVMGYVEGGTQNISAQIGKYGEVRNVAEVTSSAALEGFIQGGITSGAVSQNALSQVVANGYDGASVTLNDILTGAKTFDPATLVRSAVLDGGITINNALQYNDLASQGLNASPQQYINIVNTFQTEGYTPTPAEITSIANSNPDATGADLTAAVSKYADPLYTTKEEASSFFKEIFGVDPTPAQLTSFVGKSETAAKDLVAEQFKLSQESETAFRLEASRQTDLAEAARLAKDGAGQAAAESAAATATQEANKIKEWITANPTSSNATKNQDQLNTEKILAMIADPASQDLRYDLNNDGKITATDATLVSTGAPARTDITATGQKTPETLDTEAKALGFPDHATYTQFNGDKAVYDASKTATTQTGTGTTVTGTEATTGNGATTGTGAADVVTGAGATTGAGVTTGANTGAAATNIATTAASTGVTQDAITTAISDAISGIKFPAGLSKDDVTASIKAYMAANPGLSLADVSSKITEATKDLATSAGVNTSISDALKSYATTADINSAIANIKFPAGISKSDVAAEIKTAMEANPGLSAADVTKSITDYMTKNPGLSAADVNTAITNATKGLATATSVTDLDTKLSAAIADAKAAGLTGNEALQKAIDAVATSQNTSAASLLATMGTTADDLRTQFASDLAGVRTGVETSIADLNTKLSAAIESAKSAGMTGDAALQAAIDSVAADQKTSAASLLSAMGTSAADLKTQFATDLAGVKTGLTTSISDLNASLSAAIADAKTAGLTGDAALQAAIDSVAASQNTSAANLLATLGSTAASLKTQFATDLAGVQTGLQGSIDKLSGTVKTQYDSLTQAQKDAVAAQVQQGVDLTKAISDTASGLQTQITGLSTDLQTKYDALTQAQKDAIASQVQQGKDLTKAITDTTTGLQTQITGLSTDLQTKYDSLTQAQKDAVASQVQQGKDLSKAIADTASGLQEKIDTLSGTVKTQYESLTQAQKDAVSSQVQQGKDLTKAISDTASGLQTQITDLSASVKAQYESLTQAQKDAVATQFQQGKDLTKSIADTASGLQDQITGLSTATKAQYDALTQSQKDAISLQVQQGKDLTKAITDTASSLQSNIDSLSSAVKTQYDSLTQAQKDAVASQVQQGVDLTKAIADTASGLQTQITDLSTTTKAQYDAFTQAQKDAVASQVQQGKDLSKAITDAASNLQSQITGVSGDLQVKYESLSQAQKNAVDSQVQMGKDLRAAIESAVQTNADQITQTKVDLTNNITNVQTQFNARVDQLMQQGQDYQTATNTALKELGTGVTGLQTSVTDLQKQEADRVAAEKAATEKSRQQSSLSKAVSIFAPAAGAAALIDDSIPGYKNIGLKTSGDAKFESVLSPFEKMVQEGNYAGKQQQQTEQPTQQQLQQAAPVNQDLNQQQDQQQGSDYFNYGTQSEIDQMLGSNPGTQMLYSKKGGLATPLFAGGGTTRHGRYAGGGLPIVEHSGKSRIDFRTGNAVTGPGDGQSDDIPAMLADGEFVFPADVVAALGNGSTKAGSDKLYDMMHSIRAYHRSAKPEDLPPPAKKSPLDYLKKTKARK
jgi:hypothetical protein